MDLINELGNEIALAFLVEKKHAGKIKSSDVPTLIDKIKHILQTVALIETARHQTVKTVKKSSH